jgi:hypothetical protein
MSSMVLSCHYFRIEIVQFVLDGCPDEWPGQEFASVLIIIALSVIAFTISKRNHASFHPRDG